MSQIDKSIVVESRLWLYRVVRRGKVRVESDYQHGVSFKGDEKGNILELAVLMVA